VSEASSKWILYTGPCLLTRSLPVFLTEQPGFAVDAEARMLPGHEHVDPGLVDQFLSLKQSHHGRLQDPEHAFVGAKRKVDEEPHQGEFYVWRVS
jgi:hypothetical protein